MAALIATIAFAVPQSSDRLVPKGSRGRQGFYPLPQSRGRGHMRLAGAVLIASTLALPAPTLIAFLTHPYAAQAQSGPIHVAEAKKKGPPKEKGKPKEGGTPNYTNVPLVERVGIQFDLAFAGYFDGLITGAFDDKAIAAVKAYQKESGGRET